MNEMRMMAESFASLNEMKITEYLHVAHDQAFFVLLNPETDGDLLYVIETRGYEASIKKIDSSEYAKIDKRSMIALMRRMGG